MDELLCKLELRNDTELDRVKKAFKKLTTAEIILLASLFTRGYNLEDKGNNLAATREYLYTLSNTIENRNI